MVLPLSSALPALVLLAAAAPPPLCQGVPGEIRLDLTVAAVASERGNVTVVVYDNPATFLERGGRLFKARLPAAGTVTACLVLPRPGTYAVAVYHDADGDGKFGRNWIGLPTEGWGFSNDPPRSYGVPTFAEVSFTAGAAGSRQTIHMRYP